MNCPDCNTENRPAARFCRSCGTALARRCPDCGAPVDEDQQFCDSCGTSLAAPPEPAPVQAPVAERRLVSVLFADLVSFTALSESRDAEDVRELLSRYFETCRRLVERYGGTVEKFIGDAVMAVWGTPVANEDDAERAVRAALDLVAAVSSLADELDAPELRLRAGVLTGAAAVTVGARGEGMVAGDLVNAASRIQTAAEPGTVLVGDSTRRATEAAVAYEDSGFHQLKGRVEPVRLHRALRVIAARRGEGRSMGLEPPFVGRAPDFRLVKDLFHASAEEGRARLVSIIGIAGVGKSRLAWEFEKYVDGLVEDVRWHRGRSLAYGEGVAYSALAEMVRMRTRIADDDSTETALAKLRETLAGIIESPEERAWLEPRLAHLLGLADRSAPDKEDLFSAWRLFFERMAARDPVVLVFEDLQWADAGQLDFIEYLLDWSRGFPIFVLTLARPELGERRPTWGIGRRDFTSLLLDPLEAAGVGDLLRGLAPGLPNELSAQIVDRAEGVPLYAVETVRMLLDRGLLKRTEDGYRPTGPIETLAIPETLQSLAAARLDALDPAERRVLSDAAVLGKTFAREALAAFSGLSEEELEPHLQSLMRKEILNLQVDPLSAERNELSFVQDLLRRVAYETLSVRERKARHLAAAAQLGAERDGDDDLAAIVAAHYLAAYQAGVNDEDAEELKEQARTALTRAGKRAASLAAGGEAARYFAQAADLSEQPLERAELLELAGRAALQNGEVPLADQTLRQAVELLEAHGERRAAASVSARRAEALRTVDRIDEAYALMQAAYDELSGGEPDEGLALVTAQLARIAYFAGEQERGREASEAAIDMAETLQLPEVLAEALNAKAMLNWNRPHEAGALLREAVRVAAEHDLVPATLRAQFNLSAVSIEHSRFAEAEQILVEARDLARVRGDRTWEALILGQLGEVLLHLGRWDESLASCREAQESPQSRLLTILPLVRILCGRGQVEEAQDVVRQSEELESSTDRQTQGSFLLARAAVLNAVGRPRECLAAAEASLELWRILVQFHYAADALVEATEAALELGDLGRAETLVDGLEQQPPIQQRPLGEAQTARLRGKVLSRRGEDASPSFDRAGHGFEELSMPFWAAVTSLEHAEHLTVCGKGDEAEPLLLEAERTFEQLRAAPWLARVEAARVGEKNANRIFTPPAQGVS
jgi:class 3 adenylate cyclase/tetratricopeptide (TPR) repeat protein